MFGMLLNLGMHFSEGFATSFDQCLLSTLEFFEELGDGCPFLFKAIRAFLYFRVFLKPLPVRIVGSLLSLVVLFGAPVLVSTFGKAIGVR